MISRIVFLMIATILTGCVSSFPAAQQIKILTAAQIAPNTLPHVATSLAIPLPHTAAGLDNEQIALLVGGTNLDYFADTRWAERLPVMVQSLLGESFESARALDAVTRDSTSIVTPYELEVDIRSFEAEYDVANTIPAAHVKLVAKLIFLPTHTLIGTSTADAHVAAKDNTLSEIIAAYNQAFAQASAQVVGDSLTALTAHYNAPPPPKDKRK